MANLDQAKAAVEEARTAAFQAQVVFLETLAEQWQETASEKFRKLALELQPETTQSLGDGFGEAKAAIHKTIRKAADRVPHLFTPASSPELLVTQVQNREYGSGHISIKFGGYRGPIEELTQPLHDALVNFRYNPDLIKSKAGRANYSSSGFTDSDFPLPSVEASSAYTRKIEAYGKARFALAAADRKVAASAAQDLWNQK